MSRKSLAIVVLLLLGGSILGLYFGGVLTLYPNDYSTDARTLYSDPTSFYPTGQIDRDPSRPGQREVLDSVQYITSWKSSGNSEHVEPQGSVVIGGSYMVNARWVFFVSCASKLACPIGGAPTPSWGQVYATRTDNRGDVPFDGIIDEFFPGADPILEPNPAFSLVGSIDGWVRVELWGELHKFGLLAVSDRAWLRDDAALVSGRGTIVTPQQLQVFEVGQTVDIRVDLGAACSKKIAGAGTGAPDQGYTLELYSDGQGKNAKTWTLPCGPGTFSVDSSGAGLQYVIQPADFRAEPDCKNKNTLELRLLNDLFQKDRVSVKTIDVLANRPDKPSIAMSVEGGTWEEGKTATVTVTTNRTEALATIIIKNKETGVEVLREEKTLARSFQFTPNVAGNYEVAVSIEVDCRSSDPVRAVLTFREAQPPECKNCDPTEPGSLLWLTLIALGIGLILMAVLVPVPFKWRVVVFAVAIVFIAAGIVLIA